MERLFIACADSSQDGDHPLGYHVVRDLAGVVKIVKIHHSSAKFTPSRRHTRKVMLMRTRAKPIHRHSALVRHHILHRPLHVGEANLASSLPPRSKPLRRKAALAK